MVSVPRKYREQEENGAAVAATTPVATPEPPAEPKPAEPVEQPQASDPVRAAEQSAIAARLAEMERAEQLARQPINQPPPQHPVEPQEPPSAEQIIASSRLPDQAKDWLRQRPELVLDPIKNDQLQKAHDLAAAQTGEEFTDSYFNRMDHLLGFRQETKPNGSSNGHAAPTLPSVPSRPAAPIRQQQHAAPVSAPPTRQAPSMATGRVPQSMQVTLTADEKEVAWITRPREDMTPREAYEVYARNKMKALKDGAIGPGARDGR